MVRRFMFFNIKVQRGRDYALKFLNSAVLNLKRILFQSVKLLIIDETSMYSNIILAKTHLRLVKIMNCNKIFGELNIVAFGDLLQL